MKILITGADGQLGKSLIEQAPQSIEIIATNKKTLNLACPKDCYDYIISNKPDWIINCAAYTNVDKAEEEKELTYKVNKESVFHFANALKVVGGRILQISTDYVFDGKNNSPYNPSSKKNPLNIYGLSKSLAEDTLVKLLFKTNQAIVLRTSWLIGPYGNNFLKKMLYYHQIKDRLDIVYDQISSPTSTISLAEVCWEIINFYSNKSKIISDPILHWSNSGIASWYDLSFFIGEIGFEAGLINQKAEINPIKSDQYITKAARPHFSVLDNSITKSLLNLSVSHWQREIKLICDKIIKENIEIK